MNTWQDDFVRIARSLDTSWSVASESWKDQDRDVYEREIIVELRQISQSYEASLKQLQEAMEQVYRQTT